MPLLPHLPRLLRRQLLRLRARLRGWPLRLVYSPSYAAEWEGMPFDPIRGERILTALSVAGLAQRRLVREPPPAMYKALRRVHSDAYLDRLGDPAGFAEVFAGIFGSEVDSETAERILDLQRSMVGGTILATAWARTEGGVVANLGGGLHHAGPEGGGGFCVFNDLAVAIACERARGFHKPVLIVDLDLHDGDGTRACFAQDPSVYTLSIHNRTLGDGDPHAVASRSVALGDDVDDATYLAAIDAHLPEVLREVTPALVFVVAGTDPAEDDPLGNWKITAAGMLARDRRVHHHLRALAPSAPVVQVLAGGYGPMSWRHSARALAWLQSGATRCYIPPDNATLTILRYRHLATVLTDAELTGDKSGDDDDNWGIEPEDLLPGIGGRPPRRRFLDYYAASGIELALERYGLLDRLRAKGYARPTIVVDTDDPEVHTVRIFGEPARDNLVVEARLRRDRATLVGFELLGVDWLLLQHPAGRFSPRRPPLPGQRHPGLGLFSEVVGLLLLICDRLHLDGLVVVPSHYHLAVTWRRHLHFLEPEVAGHFDALTAALAPLGDLPTQAQALEEGALWDPAAEEPAGYRPSPMLLPLSDRLRAAIDRAAASFATRRAAARAAQRFEPRRAVREQP